MKKITNLFKILLVVFTFFIVIGNTKAFTVDSAGESGGWSVAKYHKGSKDVSQYLLNDGSTQAIKFDAGSYFYYFQTTENHPLFCLAPEVEIWAGEEDYQPVAGNYNTCGIIMGLKNGAFTTADLDRVKAGATANFGNATYEASYKKVQDSLWQYRYYTNCGTYQTTTTVTPGTMAPSIEGNDSKLYLNSAKTHYVSKKISVNKSSQITGYIVSLNPTTGSTKPSGAYISATPGGTDVGTGRINAAELYINVPVASVTKAVSLNINFTAYYQGNITNTFNASVDDYAYSDGSEKKQDVGFINYSWSPSQNEVNLGKVLSVYTEETTINIYKRDKDSKEPLKDVEFTLFAEDGKTRAKTIDGKEIPVLKTDKDGKFSISSIEEGTYVLKETNTLKGYDKQTEEVIFTVVINNGKAEIKDLKNFKDKDKKLENFSLAKDK